MPDRHPASPTAARPLVATTNNWDTVFALDFEAVNDGIRAQARFPPTFAHSQTSGGEPTSLSGSFSAWTLTGGAGRILEMQLAIPDFRITVGADPEVQRTDAVCTIQLALYPNVAPAGSGPGGGTPVAFRTRPAREDLLANPGDYAVTVTSYDWPGSAADGDLPEICRLLMADWFRLPATLAEFDHTFVTVNLNQRLADKSGDFSWITPTRSSYGVIANAARGGGTFAVLCMVGGHPAPDQHNVSPAITGTRRAGLLIDKPVVLEHLVKPGIGLMFGHVDDAPAFVASHFLVEGNVISNHKAFGFPFKLSDEDGEGDTVTATMPVRSFKLSFEDTYLSLNYDGLHHPYYKVVDYLYEAHHYLRIDAQAHYDAATRRFSLKPYEPADGSSTVQFRSVLEKSPLSKGIDYAMLTLDIVGLVASVFKLTALARPVAAGAEVVAAGNAAQAQGLFTRAWQATRAFVGALALRMRTFAEVHPWILWGGIAAGVLGITGNVAKALFEAAREDDPTLIKADLQAFTLSVMKPIQWPQGAGLAVEQVEFNGGFHITGTPDFTQS